MCSTLNSQLIESLFKVVARTDSLPKQISVNYCQLQLHVYTFFSFFSLFFAGSREKLEKSTFQHIALIDSVSGFR